MAGRDHDEGREVVDASLMSPAGMLRWALRPIPAQTKLVLSGVIVFAGTALVLGWTKEFSHGLTGAAALSILIFGLVASALSAAPKAVSVAGGFLAWTLSILFILLLVLMLSSTFFGWPPAGARLMARLLGSAEILTSVQTEAKPVVVERGRAQALSELPADLRAEPVSSDPAARVQELASLPVLAVDGTLELSGPNERRYLAASELNLGGTLLTNGGDLVVEVNNLISDNGSIRATLDPDRPQAAAAGRGGGRVLIIVHGRVAGRLSVDLRGARGLDGEAGAQGAPGSQGADGENAASGAFDCRRGAGRGGKGGLGQAGGNGTAGQSGGAGGVLIVRAADPVAARRVVDGVAVTGGVGGVGGPGGLGGNGGPGGSGGGPRGLCSGGGPTGEQGDGGPTGLTGAAGADGGAGSVIFERLPGI